MRFIIAINKIFWFLFLTTLTIPIMALWRIFFNKTLSFHLIGRLYYSLICKIFGVRYDIVGSLDDRQTVYVGNHLSYIDIAVLGSFLNATFVAKEDVRRWPILGILASLAETVFISRKREAAQNSIEQIHRMIDRERSLILFPEGTSTQGKTVLPLKSTLFEIFLNADIKKKIIIQPFTIIPIETNDKPIKTSSDLNNYSWYGDMNLAPHLWQLAKSTGAKVRIVFHPPYQATNFDHRKQLAKVCFDDISKGLKDNLTLALDSSEELP